MSSRAGIVPILTIVLVLVLAGQLVAGVSFAQVYQWSGNGHRYELVEEPTTWEEARAAAEARGGYLATVSSPAENLWISSIWGSSLIEHWIGGFQLDGFPEPDGGWTWVTGEPFVFTNWWPGEPNDAGGTEDVLAYDFAETGSGWGWNDDDGTMDLSGFLVEYEGDITIGNASFEDFSLPFSVWTLNGEGLDPWSAGPGTDVGVWHSGFAPHGKNHAYSQGPPISQVLESKLVQDSTYFLEVAVGKTHFQPFAGYSIQLRAGIDLLSEDADSISLGDDEFLTSRVVYVAPPGDPAAGQALEIRLLSSGPEANYDHVRLNVFREAAHNLATNPGFEDQLTYWQVSDGSAVYTTDDQNCLRGNWCARGVETDENSLGRLYQELTGLAVPGRTYRMSGWIKTEDVLPNNVSVDVAYVQAGGWTPAGGFVAGIGFVAGTTDWSYYESAPFVLPPKPADTVALWLLIDFNATTGTAWFDGIRLEELIAPGSAVVDNGPYSGDCCRDATESVVVEDFALSEDAEVHGVTFSVDHPESFPDLWDGHLQWWLYRDSGDGPGPVIASGNARAVNVFNGNGPYDLTVHFGTGVFLRAVDSPFWLGLHMGRDFTLTDYYWSQSASGWGSTARADTAGMGPWLDTGHHLVFGLLGEPPIFADGFELGDTSAWTSTVP